MKNDNGITNEELKVLADCQNTIEVVPKLAKALLAEREEREAMQDVWVWADSPPQATLMKVDYVGANFYLQKDYTRTLPKTRARQIAETEADAILKALEPSMRVFDRDELIYRFEEMLNKLIT